MLPARFGLPSLSLLVACTPVKEPSFPSLSAYAVADRPDTLGLSLVVVDVDVDRGPDPLSG